MACVIDHQLFPRQKPKILVNGLARHSRAKVAVRFRSANDIPSQCTRSYDRAPQPK